MGNTSKIENEKIIKKVFKGNSGITLIALVITIIVLLILAGVTIATLTGDNGLLTKAGEARNTNIEAEGLERIQLAVMASRDENGINATSLAKNLSEINGLTDIKNNEISASTEITLPKSLILNNFKYKIKADGTVIINNSILPDEYQQVEYIESSGTQWIDTKYKPNGMETLKIEAERTDMGKDPEFLFGYRTSQQNTYNLLLNDRSKILTFRYNGQSKDLGVSWMGLGKFIFLHEGGTAFVNGIKKSSISTSKSESEYNMYLFGINRYDTNNIDQYFIGKIYYCIIDKIRQFIPCKSVTNVTNSDNNPVLADTKGLYDLVEGKFYTNQGTGDFIAGPEV